MQNTSELHANDPAAPTEEATQTDQAKEPIPSTPRPQYPVMQVHSSPSPALPHTPHYVHGYGLPPYQGAHSGPHPLLYRQQANSVYFQKEESQSHPSTPLSEELQSVFRDTSAPPVVENPSVASAKESITRGHTRGRGRGRGRGAHSGVNARKGGVSDDEIDHLSEEQKKAAQLIIPKGRLRWNDEMTMKLVQFLVAPERWDKISVNLKQFSTKISQELFNNTVTSKQVFDCWSNIWRLYKDTKRHLSHTGGGDGDAPQEGAELIADFENEEVSDAAAAEGENSSKRYSASAIVKFGQSAVFEAIDKVASGRPDVQRATKFSSHRAVEDIDADLKEKDGEAIESNKSRKHKKQADLDLDETLNDTVKLIAARQSGEAVRDKERLSIEAERLKLEKERVKHMEDFEAERLALDKERSLCEAAAMEQRLRIDIERNTREGEAARVKRKWEEEESSLKKLELYNKLLKSDSVIDWAYAKKWRQN